MTGALYRFVFPALLGCVLGAIGDAFIAEPRESVRLSHAVALPGSPNQTIDRTRTGEAKRVGELLSLVRASGGKESDFANFQSAVNDWLERDPAACCAFLGEAGCLLPLNNDALGKAIMAVGHEDPAQAIALVANLQNPFVRDHTLRVILEIAAQRDPKTALSLLTQTPEYRRFELERMIAATWGKVSGAAAMDAFVNSPQSSVLLADAFRVWFEREPEAAFAYATQLQPPGKRLWLVQGIASESETSNYPRLLSYLERWPVPQDRENYIRSAVSEWARNDPDAALAWAQNRGEDLIRSLATHSVVLGIAANDEDRAMQVAGDKLSHQQRVKFYDYLARGRTDADPHQAAIRSESIEDPLTRSSAMSVVLEQWLEKDPQAAVEFASRTETEARAPDRTRLIVRQLEKSDEVPAWLHELPPDVKSRLRAESETALGGAARDRILGALDQ
ncbi:MAG: hypothetical protein ABI680_00515 [Chthoniobacteraceae bacterium]